MTAPSLPLASGRLVADGRYRLEQCHAADPAAGVELWRGRDAFLRRDVALTLLVGDTSDVDDVAAAERALYQARRVTSVSDPAVARVADVLGSTDAGELGPGVLGLVVAVWTPGWDADATAPGVPCSPGRAAAMLRPLAAVTHRAHHAGVAVGVDGPHRIRIGEQNSVVLAFPGPHPGAAAQEDVRGLAATLYFLLSGHWPDPDRAPAALTGEHPDIPRELALVLALTLGGPESGAIRTVDPLLAALDQIADTLPTLTPVRPAQDAPPRHPLADTLVLPAVPRRPVRRPPGRPRAPAHRVRHALLVIGVLVAVLAAIVGIALRADDLLGRLGGWAGAPPSSSGTPAPAAVRVVPDRLTEYLVSGSPDNPSRLGRAVDGDPATTWSTARYRQQFPLFLPGIGLLAGFDQPVRLARLDVDSPSAGTVVEVRDAPAAGSALADTRLLTTATLRAGHTEIRLPADRPTSHLLVWITTLAGGPGDYQSSIGELTYWPATGTGGG